MRRGQPSCGAGSGKQVCTSHTPSGSNLTPEEELIQAAGVLRLAGSEGTRAFAFLVWLRQSTALGSPPPPRPPSVSRQVQRPRSPRRPAGSSCAEGAKPGQNCAEEAAKATESREVEASIFSTTNPESVNVEISCTFTYRQSPRSKQAVSLQFIRNLFSHFKMYYKNTYDPGLAAGVAFFF